MSVETVSRLRIVPYEFPESVKQARACHVGSKVLHLYRLIQRSFEYTDDAAIMRVIGFHKNRTIFTAQDQDDPDTTLGFISYDIDQEIAGAYVHHLAVDQYARNNGVGSVLLHHVEDTLTDSQIGSVNLRSLESSRGFYEKLGYNVVSVITNEGKTPSYIMQLRLPRL